MAPRTTDKEERRRQILDAVIEVIAVQGAFNFKVIDVARKAKVGKGTIYEYFRSKDELIISGFTRFLMNYFEYLDRHKDPELSPPERLREYFRKSFEFLAENSRMLQVMFDFWSYLQMQRRAEQFYNELVEILGRFMADFSKIFQQGIDEGFFREFKVESVMISLFAMVDGLTLQYAMGQINLADPSIADELTELVLKGISANDQGE